MNHPSHPADVDATLALLSGAGLRRRPPARDRGLPRAQARAAAVPRRRGGRRQDRDRQGARGGLGRRSSACSATRARHRGGRLRVELSAADDRDPARRGRRRRRARRARARHLHDALPAEAPAAAGAGAGRRRRAGAADRRARPHRRAVRGVPARSALRLPGDDPRARHRSARPTPPIVVITSNRTREIHDAIKRRCLYHWVDYPDAARELEIVRRKCPAAPEALAREIVAFMQRLRAMDLFKAPGVAETLDWAEALVALDRDRARSADGRRHARRAAQVPGRRRRDRRPRSAAKLVARRARRRASGCDDRTSRRDGAGA